MIKEFLLRLILNEYEVTLWMDPKVKVVYNFKRLSELSPKHIKGRLTSGELFELRTQEPFNYQIRQIR
jgi:hypothetical protein